MISAASLNLDAVHVVAAADALCEAPTVEARLGHEANELLTLVVALIAQRPRLQLTTYGKRNKINIKKIIDEMRRGRKKKVGEKARLEE